MQWYIGICIVVLVFTQKQYNSTATCSISFKKVVNTFLVTVTMNRKKVCCNLFKGFIYGICIILFLVYGIFILEKYFNELTSTSVEINYKEKLLLPSFTICLEIPFKPTAKSYPLTNEEFYEMTYSLEDIFYLDTIRVSISTFNVLEHFRNINITGGPQLMCHSISVDFPD